MSDASEKGLVSLTYHWNKLTNDVLWILQEKITSWACLLGSGLKLIFHWNAQLLIILKSLFKWLEEALTFYTMKKRDVSSAKSLPVLDRSLERSLMYIKRIVVQVCNSGTHIALIKTQGETCSFKMTCCFLKIRKWVVILGGVDHPLPTPTPIPNSFSPVTSRNIGISPKNFLTFSFNPFAMLV